LISESPAARESWESQVFGHFGALALRDCGIFPPHLRFRMRLCSPGNRANVNKRTPTSGFQFTSDQSRRHELFSQLLLHRGHIRDPGEGGMPGEHQAAADG